MNEKPPHLVLLAGPNGSGKTTIAPRLLKGNLGVSEFVNADLIAGGLSVFDPDLAAMADNSGGQATRIIARGRGDATDLVSNSKVWNQIHEDYPRGK